MSFDPLLNRVRPAMEEGKAGRIGSSGGQGLCQGVKVVTHMTDGGSHIGPMVGQNSVQRCICNKPGVEIGSHMTGMDCMSEKVQSVTCL